MTSTPTTLSARFERQYQGPDAGKYEVSVFVGTRLCMKYTQCERDVLRAYAVMDDFGNLATTDGPGVWQ